MTVTDDPGDPMLVAAQEDAIANRRGIWAHGVPEFVLTSLHSVDESVGRKDRARNYNRLVSSADGHSVKWKHQDAYNECDKVCHKTYRVDEAKVDAVAKALQGDKRFAKALAGLSPDVVRGVVRDFARLRHINRDVPEDERDALAAHLRDLANRGELGSDTAGEPASCMVHVPFKRRYGGGKAECLK
jgi:endonuclease YncB( thermonuclease family)